ncbi:MAG: patatin-like phospholipase family protein [Azospirillaceae bacterium]
MLLPLFAACSLGSDNLPLAAAPADHVPGYDLAGHAEARGLGDVFVAVLISGGGLRSAAMGLGALEGLASHPLPGGGDLLDEVDLIVATSGGGVPAIVWAAFGREALFALPETVFARDTDADLLLASFTPFHGAPHLPGLAGTGEAVVALWEEWLFAGLTFADLDRTGAPLVALVASDFARGDVFTFTQSHFDLICSDLAPTRLATALTTTTALPILSTPITLDIHAAGCPRPTPAWLAALVGETHPLFAQAGIRGAAFRYANARLPVARLYDGGIADNLAVHAFRDMLAATGSPEALLATGLGDIERGLVLVVDGRYWPESPLLQVTTQALATGFDIVAGAPVETDHYAPVAHVEETVAWLEELMAEARCGADRAACPVAVDLVRLTLEDLPDPIQRITLREVPTRMTIGADTAESLAAFTRQAVQADPRIHAVADPADR